MPDPRAVLLRRTVHSRMDTVADLCREAKDALAGVRMTPEAVYGVELVLEEILSNVAKYAYAPGSRGFVELDVENWEGTVLLRFADSGPPFDPLSVPPPPPILSRERPGGLGISLVRSVARDVRYRREAGRNILEVEIPTG